MDSSRQCFRSSKANEFKKEFPNVKLIDSKENLGFAKANNLAFREARGEFIFLINNDAILTETSFAPLVHALNTEKNCGAVCPKVLYANSQKFWNLRVSRNCIHFWQGTK